MTEPDYRAAMKAVRRVAEILIQLPLEDCLDLHNESLARPKGENETQEEFDAANKQLTDSKRMIEAMITVKLVKLENRANNAEQVNINNAIAAAAWSAILSK